MQKVTRVLKNVEEIDVSNYINPETGEILSSETGTSNKIIMKKDTGMRTIESTDYAVIDSEAVHYLSMILGDSDLAKVLKMTVLTKTPLNIIYNNNLPHTNETLQKYLQMSSESMYIKLIRKLIKIGILYQIKGRILGEVRVCYMLNPYLSRKRKNFESKVFEVFETFSKEYRKELGMHETDFEDNEL